MATTTTTTTVQNPPIIIAHVFSLRPHGKLMRELETKLKMRFIEMKLYDVKDPVPNNALIGPRVYLSVGGQWNEYKQLKELPFYQRKRWLHYPDALDILPDYVYNCWLKVIDPLPPVIHKLPPTQFSSDLPLVSIFTTSYRSGEKIRKPYQSLLNQTYKNWEWIIVDDSGDDEKTYKDVLLYMKDSRIKRFRQDHRSGYIGEVKRYAAGLCTGEIFVEIDHDDDLQPNCLSLLVEAFKAHPDCGFAFGQTSEVFVKDFSPHCYGWNFGFGWGVYWRQWVALHGRWQNTVRVTDMNWKTIRHLVGLPNHPRAWTRVCYHTVGGHSPELLVSDDYDLLVRTFLYTRFIAIPHMVYIQYRNDGGDNFTFHRNHQIQILCQELERYYRPRINKRFKEELRFPQVTNEGSDYKRIWTVPQDNERWLNANVQHEDTVRKSHIFVVSSEAEDTSKYKEDITKLVVEAKNEEWKKHEIVVVCAFEIPPDFIEPLASNAPDGSIRWWSLEDKKQPTDPINDSTIDDCLNYASLLCSCKEKVIYKY